MGGSLRVFLAYLQRNTCRCHFASVLSSLENLCAGGSVENVNKTVVAACRISQKHMRLVARHCGQGRNAHGSLGDAVDCSSEAWIIREWSIVEPVGRGFWTVPGSPEMDERTKLASGAAVGDVRSWQTAACDRNH